MESTPGVGSTFHFTVRLESGHEGLIAPERSASSQGKDWVGGLRILVVDDNEVNRDLARMVLERDHLVSTARDGLEALRVLAEAATPFDVVLMDVQMPEMDGLTVTRVIRAVEKRVTLPLTIEDGDLLRRLSDRLAGGHLRQSAHRLDRLEPAQKIYEP